MRRRLSAVLLFTVVAFGGRPIAQAPAATTALGRAGVDGMRKPVAPALPPSGSSAPSSTTVKVSGTIKGYEASTRLLTLSTSKAAVQFSLPPGTRIRRGGRPIEPSDLRDLVGHRADVRYSDSGTARVVESVHVFDRSPSAPPR